MKKEIYEMIKEINQLNTIMDLNKSGRVGAYVPRDEVIDIINKFAEKVCK